MWWLLRRLLRDLSGAFSVFMSWHRVWRRWTCPLRLSKCVIEEVREKMLNKVEAIVLSCTIAPFIVLRGWTRWVYIQPCIFYVLGHCSFSPALTQKLVALLGECLFAALENFRWDAVTSWCLPWGKRIQCFINFLQSWLTVQFFPYWEGSLLHPRLPCWLSSL